MPLARGLLFEDDGFRVCEVLDEQRQRPRAATMN